MRDSASLTPKQERLITALLQGSTIVEAAATCKINESTAYRWFGDAAFQAAYTQARKRLVNHAITSLQLRFDKAVKTLDRHMNEDSETIPRDQIKAAEVVVDKTIQTAQLVERIAELETRIAEYEQTSQGVLIFHLGDLTPEQRRILKGINDSIAGDTIRTE